MIKVLFFASLREQVNCENIELDANQLTSVSDVKNCLSSYQEGWDKIFANPSLLAAVNQEMVDEHHSIKDGDEVAFFPPVTGG